MRVLCALCACVCRQVSCSGVRHTKAQGMVRGKLGDDRFMHVRERLTFQASQVMRGSC